MNQFQKCQGCNLIATILEMSEDTGFIHKHSFFFSNFKAGRERGAWGIYNNFETIYNILGMFLY